MTRGFELVETHKKHEEEIVIDMPLRATKTSAGYDFYTPVDLVIPPQTKVMVWTDIKSYMQVGEVLLLDVTSGIGAKKDCMLANTIGVVDQDYYNNEGNEGNIGICLRNLRPSIELEGFHVIHLGDQEIKVPLIKDLREENTVVFKAGDKIGQGIFVNYLTSDNCNGEAVRKGGYGSTDKK